MEERFRLYMVNKHQFNLKTFEDNIEESFENVPDLQMHDILADQFLAEEEEEEDVDDPELEPMLGWDMNLED